MSSRTKEVRREVGIALGGTLVTMMLGFLTKVVLDVSNVTRIQNNPVELTDLLAVQFDLLVISLSLVLGVAANATTDVRGRLFHTLWLLGAPVLIALVLAGLSQVAFPKFHPRLMRIVIPDILGAVGLYLAARAVIAAKGSTSA